MSTPLLASVGVQSGVLRTIMQWVWRQKGWRAVLLRMALLTAVWLALAFVFATEIYLSAQGAPIKISWRIAAESAFRDWFPWILLSPLAIALANRFRFDRNNWRHSLMLHCVACVVFAIAYQGLLLLAYPGPFALSTSIGGIGAMVHISNPRFQGFRLAGEVAGPITTRSVPIPEGPNVVFSGQTHGLAFNGGLVSPAGGSNTMVVGFGMPPLLTPPPPGSVDGIRLSAPGPWTRFLTLATTRMQFTVPIYLCIICVCWVLNHFQEAGEQQRRTVELESRLTQANLQALKMQLQPHFLFNTLNAISSLIQESPKAAEDMIGSLSQFLRTTLEVRGKNEVPLSQELQFVDRYLEIQQTRFGNRLHIQREIDSQSMEALVPPLLLQPLVENAIRYGIESRESTGTVTMRAYRRQERLHLEVSDDGEGFKSGQLLAQGNGVGLSNTKARLQELYGAQHQFKIVANEPKGACVKIEIPIRFAQPDRPNGV